MSAKHSVLAVCDGVLYVQIDYVMPSLFAHIDGVKAVFMRDRRGRRSGPAYMTVDAALEWLRKEVQRFPDDRNCEKRRKTIAILEVEAKVPIPSGEA